jgi:hypothetical protein
MSNKFTAQELADFYQQVADGGEAEFRNHPTEQWSIRTSFSPSLSSIHQNWRIKPAKKVIDLSVLIDSQIDCEFRDGIGERPNIGKLLEIKGDCWDMYPYTTGNSSHNHYAQCQPRTKHKHAWQDGECPLPEGFEAKVWLHSGGHTIVTNMDSDCWGWGDAMYFEVIGIADGYVMPWEDKDNE